MKMKHSVKLQTVFSCRMFLPCWIKVRLVTLLFLTCLTAVYVNFTLHTCSCTSKPPEDFPEDTCSISSSYERLSALDEHSSPVLRNFNSLPSWEDWDEEIEDCTRIKGAHPEITLSDNEFTGDIHVQDLGKTSRPKCFRLAEEDWIFVNAD